MGSILLQAFLRDGLLKPADTWATAAHAERTALLKDKLKVHAGTDNAEAVALGVNAPGTEVGAEPFGRNGIVAATSEFADFVEVHPRIFFALEALDLLRFGFF
jgi:hypothetical protein